MASLMDRLARFVASGDAAVRGQLEQADAFGQLKAAAAKVRLKLGVKAARRATGKPDTLA